MMVKSMVSAGKIDSCVMGPRGMGRKTTGRGNVVLEESVRLSLKVYRLLLDLELASGIDDAI